MACANVSERLCLFCSGPISGMRSAASQFCGVQCAANHAKSKRENIQVEKATKAPSALAHSCFASPFDPYRGHCRRRLTLSDAEIRELFLRQEAFNLKHRSTNVWDGGPVILLKKYRLAPKAVVTGRIHIERAYTASDSSREIPEAETLRRLVDEDRMSRSLEEKLQIEYENEITLLERALWIVQVPEEIFDRDRERNINVPVMQHGHVDQRTPGGIAVTHHVPQHISRIDREELRDWPDEFKEAQVVEQAA
jgi:hypothetical protein